MYKVKKMTKTDEKLVVNGKRLDGRSLKDLRNIEMSIDVIDRANGSARVKFGDTEAITSVFGPRKLYPRFMQEADTGIIRYRYNMAPFSVIDRKRPGPGRRGMEISKVSKLAFEPSTILDDFPRTVVDIFTEIIQADGSTRVTGINAASMALATAGVPMKDLVVACSVGKIGDELVVDLNGLEDNNSEADVAIAMLPTRGKISLLQMDGRLTKEEMFKLIDFAVETCTIIHEKQKEAIKQHYESKRNLEEEDENE